MTSDDYRQAGDLFDRLRDLPEAQRAAALNQACAGKAELRSEVWRLLEADNALAGGSFLERPAIEEAALLLASQSAALPTPGTVIGNYRLASRIGAGGMGVVFEGQDLRLQRRVAIKILPLPVAGEGVERIRRFQREARAASLLNHPNIVSIFDANSHQGYYYIATELIEGKTLRQLLAAEPRGLDTSTMLDLLAQTASALSAAHEAGIVHRDIKPENIMVRRDGFVKVLDFGLAKLREPSSDPAHGASDLSTRPGHIAGTIHYLSPEQVAGKPVDSRSDLFSLGVVAYELATGTRPFDGPTDGAVYDAILHRTPLPPSSVRPALAGEFDILILRALEKDPEYRYQTASDLRSFCKGIGRATSQPDLAPAPPRTRRRHLGWKTVAAVMFTTLAVATLGYIVWHSGTRGNALLPVQFQRLTDVPGEETSPSLSPDGKQFVYASAGQGNWDIYLQRTGGNTFLNLTRDCKQDDIQPALSPDGSRIVFRSERDGGGLFVMESTGENPRRISPRGYLPAWAPDGRHVVYSTGTFETPSQRRQGPFSLFVIDLEDGSVKRIDSSDALQPSWSPHGHRIAYWGNSAAGGRRDIFTVDSAGKYPPVAVTADAALDWNPVWSPSGAQLYFLSDRGGTMNIWRVPIDERSGRTLGPPEPATVPAPNVGSLSLAPSGKSLIYSQSSRRINLARIGFDPDRKVAIGTLEPLAGGYIVANFSFSPDGSQLVFDTLGDSSEDLWIMHADGSGRRRVTSDSYRNRSPSWSPDGQEILFFSDRGGQYDNWVIRTDGSGLRALTSNTRPPTQNAIWSPDSSRILAGRWGTPLLLDPRAGRAASNPPNPPGLGEVEGVFFDLWTAGAGGGLVICELLLGPTAPEIVLYSPSQGKLEHTGVSGRLGFWLLGDKGSDPPYRYFIFARDADCYLYDRTLKRETRLFSLSPNRIYDLAMPPDGRQIYFSQTIRDSDLWLARLAP